MRKIEITLTRHNEEMLRRAAKILKKSQEEVAAFALRGSTNPNGAKSVSA